MLLGAQNRFNDEVIQWRAGSRSRCPDTDRRRHVRGRELAQEFFPADARAGTLAAILRALKPGGLLLVQELFPPLELDTTQNALDRVFFGQLGTEFGRPAEEIADEGQAAGFELAEIIASPLGPTRPAAQALTSTQSVVFGHTATYSFLYVEGRELS